MKAMIVVALMLMASFAVAQDAEEPGELPSLEEIDRSLHDGRLDCKGRSGHAEAARPRCRRRRASLWLKAARPATGPGILVRLPSTGSSRPTSTR